MQETEKHETNAENAAHKCDGCGGQATRSAQLTIDEHWQDLATLDNDGDIVAEIAKYYLCEECDAPVPRELWRYLNGHNKRLEELMHERETQGPRELVEQQAELSALMHKARFDVVNGDVSPDGLELYFHSPGHVEPFLQAVAEYHYHGGSAIDLSMEKDWKYGCIVFDKGGGQAEFRVRTLVRIPVNDIGHVLEAMAEIAKAAKKE
jgi:hypothetical protein